MAGRWTLKTINLHLLSTAPSFSPLGRLWSVPSHTSASGWFPVSTNTMIHSKYNKYSKLLFVSIAKFLHFLHQVKEPMRCLLHVYMYTCTCMPLIMYAYVFLYILVCVCVCVLMTDRSHDAREAPLCAEESVAVQASPFIQTAVQHVHPDHVRVHGVRVLPHGSLDNRLPWVTTHKTAQNNMKGEEMH